MEYTSDVIKNYHAIIEKCRRSSIKEAMKIFSPIKNKKRLKTIDKLLRNEKYFSKSHNI